MPVVAGVIGTVVGVDPADLEAVRDAQRDAAVESADIVSGPETSDLPTLDGLHFNDAAVPFLLERWCTSLGPFYTGLGCPVVPVTQCNDAADNDGDASDASLTITINNAGLRAEARPDTIVTNVVDGSPVEIPHWVLLGNDAYGGTFRLIAKVWSPLGFPWTAVDLTDLDALRADWPDDTGMIWLETPTNPLLTCFDIEAISTVAHERGALVQAAFDGRGRAGHRDSPSPFPTDLRSRGLLGAPRERRQSTNTRRPS